MSAPKPEVILREAKWTRLVRIQYKDPRGRVRDWESAERSTCLKGSDIDGVGIVAILEKPTGQIMIDVPAGLVDEGETAEQAAVRELREETGYVGKAMESSPLTWNDPGFCNTNLRMIHVSIDMALPENQDLKPELEENEFIEVFYVPLRDLWDECKKLEARGFGIDARVGTLAEGIELSRRFKV